MARWVRRGIVLLLAVAAVASGALWVRTHYRSDLITYDPPSGEWKLEINTDAGEIIVLISTAQDERPVTTDTPGWHGERGVADFWLVAGDWGESRTRFAGFARANVDGRPGADFVFPRIRVFAIPCWFLVGLAGAGPMAAAIRGYRRRNRKREGFCTRCGYDLRASPERCPECGALIGGSRGTSRPAENPRSKLRGLVE